MGKLIQTLQAKEPMFLLQIRWLLEMENHASLPLEVEQLLKEFTDVFLKDLLNGIPLEKGIEHATDL